jgi:predicted ATPase
MQLKSLFLEKYYHLEKFKIDFTKPISVFIGENGSGKSTLLEAIIEIFRNLYYTESLPIPFKYTIEYTISSQTIEISTLTGIYEIKINGEPKDISEIQQISKTWIYKKIPEKLEGILPDNVLMYYSGQSDRINKHFEKIDADYQEALKNGFDMGFKPLFLFHPIHCKIILLGLFASKLDDVKTFLKSNFQIAALESFVIILKKPNWGSSSKSKIENFWNAQKIVADYLSNIKSCADSEIRVSNEKLVLKFDSLKKLDELVNLPFVGYESNLVKLLDSLFTAGFIDDIELVFRIKNDKIISFQNLSEGEQQLIAIKGMTELLRGQETLYLLDEPDNYLHPSWQETLLLELSIYQMNTHFLVTTHSPQLLTNANPEYAEVFILFEGKLQEEVPPHYGKDINSILYSLMDTKYRNEDVSIKLDLLFKNIALKNVEEAEKLYSELQSILKNDPKLVGARAEIDFLKLDSNEANTEAK